MHVADGLGPAHLGRSTMTMDLGLDQSHRRQSVMEGEILVATGT